MKCRECGTKSKEAEVLAITSYWSCGGRGVHDFNWIKIDDDNLPLCIDCESNQFLYCDNCGDLISNDCIVGMEEYDDDSERLRLKCPGCEKYTDW